MIFYSVMSASASTRYRGLIELSRTEVPQVHFVSPKQLICVDYKLMPGYTRPPPENLIFIHQAPQPPHCPPAHTVILRLQPRPVCHPPAIKDFFGANKMIKRRAVGVVIGTGSVTWT